MPASACIDLDSARASTGAAFGLFGLSLIRPFGLAFGPPLGLALAGFEVTTLPPAALWTSPRLVRVGVEGDAGAPLGVPVPALWRRLPRPGVASHEGVAQPEGVWRAFWCTSAIVVGASASNARTFRDCQPPRRRSITSRSKKRIRLGSSGLRMHRSTSAKMPWNAAKWAQFGSSRRGPIVSRKTASVSRRSSRTAGSSRASSNATESAILGTSMPCRMSSPTRRMLPSILVLYFTCASKRSAPSRPSKPSGGSKYCSKEF
mmetsp:Transcript_60903/g.132110  ORF Transcript_60903/g.132110 Transcript_60903/m.132110 type:complete len:261 (+) Transcript_60903:562-1344(+)